jgi:hypothetical protein
VYIKDKFYIKKIREVEDLKTWIRDVITTNNILMAAYTWEELKFCLNVFFPTWAPHIELH